MSRDPQPSGSPRERVLVCGVLFPEFGAEFEGELSEVKALIEASQAEIVGQAVTQRRLRPHPATLMGKGKVEEIKEQVDHLEPDAVVVDNDLTPAQVRNLEKAWGLRVIDRSELILDIFARRAQTRQARLQVELAQNEYLLPRLRRMWTHLERLEGAIGTRGPGETQLETDRRLLDRRIADLKVQLAQIESRRLRQVRSRGDAFTVGLVGYTNAGKSTLLNRLTNSDEFVADMPFATLDTRTRKWILPDRRVVLLSDTVGFLARLPHHLVASFHATLEETLHADLLLHVVDASHPDAPLQMQAVEKVLASISPHLHADVILFNKVDRVEDPIRLHLLLDPAREIEVVHLSACTGEGIERLTRLVMRQMDERSVLVEVELPAGDGRLAALVKSSGSVLREEYVDGSTLRLLAKLAPDALGKIRRAAGPLVRIQTLRAAGGARLTGEGPLEGDPESDAGGDAGGDPGD
ncbi:MAG: GTPase HflX [Planctomycetota bacterium]